MNSLLGMLPEKRNPTGGRVLDIKALRAREQQKHATTPSLIKSSTEERHRQWRERESEAWQALIPRRWRKARLSHFEEPWMQFGHSVVNRIASGNPLASTFLWSPVTGSGKTYLTYAILNELHDRELITSGNASLATESDIADIATSGFDREEKMRDLLHGKEIILIDDMSGRARYGWSASHEENRRSVWFNILEHVYSHSQHVFITSNVSPDKMRGLIGDQAFDRLRHLTSSGDLMRHFDRASFRDTIAQRVNDAYSS